MKYLISWIGIDKDFETGDVSGDGPNFLLHKLRDYSFEKHIVLYNKDDHSYQARLFQQRINKEFPSHKVELTALRLVDERDLNEVQEKVGGFIKRLEDDDVTILLSTGTGILKIAWYIFASSFQQQISLIQYRANHNDFAAVNLQKSSAPYTLMVNEQSLSKKRSPSQVLDFFIPKSLERVYQKAERIAHVDNTVLILGDTGTGKENLACHIHKKSARRNNPFVAVNCAAFNDELLSSELFGHVKGSFTGALANKKGVFELSNEGTVFLDEIGDISPFMQQSLLRVLQNRKIQKLGEAGKEININVRIIAATNKNLLAKVACGEFREDLYYRLAVNELELPSLDDWSANDKRNLIDFIISKKASELKVKGLKLSAEVDKLLMSYSFPGNIRELENLIAGLYPFTDEHPIEISDLPKRLRTSSRTSLRWEEVEAEHIKKVLKLMSGNQSEACKQIGYTINTFKSRIKAYKIRVDEYKG